MAYRCFRRPALAAGFVALTFVAAFADPIPQLNPSRPHPMPVYPDAAKRAGQTGTTVVAVHVNEIGRPYEIATATSSGSPALDKAAVEAVRRWHFIAAEKDGVDVAEWTAVGFTFGPDGVVQVPVSPDTEIARQDRNRKVCRTPPPVTGSNLPSAPVCKPAWQWEDEARQAKDLHWKVPGMATTGGGGSGK